ncbi:NRAMP family divalent metal transporter [Microbulbifer sp. GL-2]|uniref:NRAMP family divalent metal transporter n=1 Tax=Microbulbifer sp. GL-2 TaxID=2591606 RepID=UPI00117F50AD|nr:divalent metal cation transporter [Microbulbifer sp. GL-2]
MDVFKRTFSNLGPGIIWAASSIGVSHIVQSTRAGADYAFALIGFIFLAHLIKYPFFKIGPEYAAVTGESLLEGYRKHSRWGFYSYLALTLLTMFFVQAAVTIITAALALNLFGSILNISEWSAVILITTCGILAAGQFKWLNESLKWMVLLLAIASLITLIAAISQYGFLPANTQLIPELSPSMSIAFIVALVGWMPTSIEVSVWHSIWSERKIKEQSERETSKKSLVFDFKVGYFTSLLLAIIFVWLGALIMFGKNIELSQSAGIFAGQLISIYTESLGDWSHLTISIICFIALFSTTFAVSDGFPQVWRNALKNSAHGKISEKRIYLTVLITLSIISWFIISLFANQLKNLIDFVTTLSFVCAPIFALLNVLVMNGKWIPKEHHLKGWYLVYTYTCLGLMIGFSCYFIYWRFFE